MEQMDVQTRAAERTVGVRWVGGWVCERDLSDARLEGNAGQLLRGLTRHTGGVLELSCSLGGTPV